MTLTPYLLRAKKLLRQQNDLLLEQAEIIEQQLEELRAIHLEYNREMQGLVAAWLINLECPELDVRHDLANLERAVGNRIAELEEHVL